MFDDIIEPKEPFWKRPLVKVLTHVMIGVVIIVIGKLAEKYAVPPDIQIKIMLYIMFFLSAEAVVYFGARLKQTTKNIELTSNNIIQQNVIDNAEIIRQNAETNAEFIRIATKDIEEKVYRKLVSTNAVIPDRDRKIAITARILDDFPNKDIYKLPPGDHKKTTESIDLVRVLSYQNLLLTPKYLEYFFYRKDSVRKATRIIVLDREQVNEKICQATLTFVFISARYGYKTYILPEKRFRKLLSVKDYPEEYLKMIKGNPFMLKITNGADEEYKGEYTNYQKNIENNGETVNINSGQEAWRVLDNIKDNSLKITALDSEFADRLKGAISTINSKSIV